MSDNHYAHCASMMLRHKQTHMQRLLLTIGMLLINFYTHVLTFGVKYAGAGLTEYYASQDEGRDRFASVSGYGIGIAALIGCGVALFLARKIQNKNIRIGVIASVFVALLAIGLAGRSHQATNLKDNGVHVSYLAYGMGMLTLILSVTLIVLCLFAEPKRKWLHFAVIGLFVIGILTDCFAWWLAVIPLLFYVISLKQVKEAAWLKTQAGYPYFNERFDEQTKNSEYKPLHRLDDAAPEGMTDIYGEPVPSGQTEQDDPYEHYRKRKERQAALLSEEEERMKQYRLSEAPEGEMPGIEFKTEEELAEERAAEEAARLAKQPAVMPDLPDANDIVLPTFDEPQQTEAEAAIGTDFPEIASDIPDLPEIPDIPKL